ncbi:MAG: SMC-Scp complex subunit ScpB [Rhodospirillaceae bacterium]|nr:SMC-Scp complex subunit ScpB [Rhodospirillaceae bacterium]|tara:strand:+ start:2139 stop:2711 length:573 start_codon:yes stop_codon:yes gene_type:complete
MVQNDKIIRMMEAILFAAVQPLSEEDLSERLPDGINLNDYIEQLKNKYAASGINLIKVAGGWSFRTAPDLSFLLEKERTVTRRLSRAAIETLAIIAYHQPITRAEIEEIRGVALSKGTVDLLMEANWVILKGRKKAPGRPVMYGTSNEFLNHFGLDNVDDLPGIEELKATGLLSPDPPQNINTQDDESHT